MTARGHTDAWEEEGKKGMRGYRAPGVAQGRVMTESHSGVTGGARGGELRCQRECGCGQEMLVETDRDKLG